MNLREKSNIIVAKVQYQAIIIISLIINTDICGQLVFMELKHNLKQFYILAFKGHLG